MVRRAPVLCLALVVPLVATGCHAGLSRRTDRPAPTPAPTQEAVSKDKFIAMHNRNALAIHSLDAKPRIEAVTPDGGRHSANGKLSLERPDRFSLKLRGPARTSVADIGSNEQGFWFWVKDNDDRAVYTCAHKDAGASPLAASFQPDWIIEALGLRVIEPAEARVIDARPGERPGQLVLTQLRKDGHGEMLTKETVVREQDGLILEHRLWQGAKTKLLAKATIRNYQSNLLEGASPGDPKVKLHYPSDFSLEWVEEKMILNVVMNDPTINPTFDQDQQAAIFTEPKIGGYKRIDLATLGTPDRSTASANASRIHETRPVPPSSSPAGGAGIRLGDPEAIGDGAMRTSAEPLASADDAAELPRPRTSGTRSTAPRPVENVPPPTPSAAGSNRFRGPIFGR